MAKKNKWKNREGVVYSTSDAYDYTFNDAGEASTQAPEKQRLRIRLDKRQRAGKQVTLVKGFVGSTTDLQELAKKLKTKCGTGGAAKDGEIVIQGDFRQKIVELLKDMGYKDTKLG